jgi:hypothetical protein
MRRTVASEDDVYRRVDAPRPDASKRHVPKDQSADLMLIYRINPKIHIKEDAFYLLMSL